jgi:ELWxxDGT repeat protein
MVKDILASANESAIRWDERMVNVGGTLFFPANGGQGFELWKSNGTRAGTAQVRDINPLTTCDESGSYPGSGSSPCSSWPSGLTQVDGTLFFAANDGSHGWELWKSDGTEAGTVLVKDIWPLEDRSSLDEYPRVMAGMNGLLFFAARDGREKELWQSDGTEAGTVLVRDINTFASSYPEELTPMEGTLFFRANDGWHGRELWVLSEACCQIFLPLVFSP